MIKYLKNTGTSSTASLNDLILSSPSFGNIVTISNTAASIDSVTGALIVAGGIGTSGNINAAQDINALGNIKALNGEFVSNLTVQGHTNSNYVNVPGILTARLGEFELITSNTLNVVGQTVTNSLEVTNNGNFGSITATTGSIETLTSTTLTGLRDLETDNADVNNLRVDNIYPNTGSQVNLGDVGNIRIVGGSLNQVLGTDGNGNLTWLPGTGAITVGTGLRRDGDVISLSGTGFVAGTFNQVTVDEYGRVVFATNFINDLQDVTSRGGTTDKSISITSTTESIDTATGALTVAGGVGVGGTLTAQNLAVVSNIQLGNTLSVTGQTNFNNTVNFNSTQVPFKISSGTLVSNPLLGSIEFDGTSLYITTTFGRQLIQVKNSQLSATPTFIARAVAARNINIANGNQYTANGEDNWDDVILEIQNVVLLTQQTNPAENGLYIWNTENSPLTRHPDFNSTSTIRQGTIIFVSEGLDNAGSFYKVTNSDPITIGTTPLTINQHFNADNIALSALPKNSAAGLLVRTSYGSIALRQVQSTTSWLTITNPTGYDGDITISTITIPVSSGGTGRTSINGWMKGLGGSIQSTPTIPLADIDGAGTIASQNANNVSIIGGTIDNVTIGETTSTSGFFSDLTVITNTNVGSVYFDGNGDYLAINNPPLGLRDWGSGSTTIEMWVYANSFSQDPTENASPAIGHLAPASYNLPSYREFFWSFGPMADGSIRFRYRNLSGNKYNIYTTAKINTGQWYHLAFVNNASSLSIYINGVQQTLAGTPGNAISTNGTPEYYEPAPLVIGRTKNAFFNGYISNVRITKSALYTTNFTPSTVPLGVVPGTSLLTCQGNEIVDASTNSYTIFINDNVESSTLNPFSASTVIPHAALVLNDYLTGLFRVVGDTSLNGILQVANKIYKNGYEVISDNDIIDGGTY